MIKSINDYSFSGKKVLVRVDFNVPIDENLKITDDTRIISSLPTIEKILKDGGIPVLCSHLGRPKGKVNSKYSLKPVADYLASILNFTVHFAEDCIGEPAEDAVAKAKLGEIVLLENLRFHPEEEGNVKEFSESLASLTDVYVNDAFGSAHRAHASTEGVTKFFGENKFAGFLLLKELKYLGSAMENPQNPFVSIIGGAKISGKIDVIRKLLEKCDSILIGGGMTFTFLKAKGYNIGNSLLEEDRINLAKELLEEAKERKVNLILPSDIIIAKEFNNNSEYKIVPSDKIPDGWIGMDIGIAAQNEYFNIINNAKTVFWNGPMGVFEMTNFANGTLSIAKGMKESTGKGAVTIVGGGDSVAAINQLGFSKDVSHVSTGGGASLEFIEGKVLPGVKALEI
ncbi:MAG: phosphoglycerate kinase [Ignavibacteria bacterium GWF2_33_9]|nr:MAG: phosphoglycerate kinase [Ignavibacteria bacterium GWF2_33_9]